jgi:4-hydroxy-3-methylbut-2-enyl diphosphate reductase
MVVVESVQDVAQLRVGDPDRVAYVTQTTLSVSEAADIIAALKARFPSIQSPPREDICYATTNRQAAVRELAADVDLVLIIGSRNSSNSQRLVETARLAGGRAHLIDDESEIDPGWFAGVCRVLVTAGASAPEHLVESLLARLRRDWSATVQIRSVAQEDLAFALPRSIQSLTVGGRPHQAVCR